MTIWIPKLKDSTGPRYLAIAQAIETAIRCKELRPGQKLPTHRELAYQLNVSVQTVSRAYAEAERRRLVAGEIGRGTYVQLPRSESASSYIADSGVADLLDFSNISALLTDEHDDALSKSLRDASKESPISRLFAFRPTAGVDVHREAGANWMHNAGISVSPDNVVVTNSGAHGVWAAMASAAAPGDVVATETLVDYTIITNASILKLRLRGLPIDEEGILPEGFQELCEREPVKLLCTTPCYSNPTASMMGEPRRQAIAEIARRHDVTILESDDYGPFAPSRPKPIWHFAPERTYYSTSAMVTGLMAGFLAAPQQWLPRLITRFRATGWMANSWASEVVSKWIYDGTAEKLSDIQRKRLKSRHRVFEKTMHGYSYISHAYAPHVWLTLPDQWRSGAFVQEARRRGLLVTPPDPFITGRATDPHAIRLAFGDTVHDEQEFARGMNMLGDLIRSDPDVVDEHF